MKEFVRQHALAVSGVLSAVALALVFGAVLGVVPERVLPRATDSFLALVPTINVVLSVTAIATILLGVRWARRRDIERHRVAMVASALLFATFLVLYLYRIVLVGTTEFGGPETVYTFVYLPVLAVHMLLAVVCVPLVIYALVLASVHPVDHLSRTDHPRVGRVAAPLWVVSFALGTVVYVLLHVVYAG